MEPLGTTGRYRFPAAARLDKPGVQRLLDSGKRLGGAGTAPWSARVSGTGNALTRLAIAVPKRFVKSSVDRNRLKRIVREAFRQHPGRHASLDMLVQFNGVAKSIDRNQLYQAREAITRLLGRAAEKAAQRLTKMSLLAKALLVLIRGYQYALSPYFGSQCRFSPTCSHYATEAINRYGAIKGGFLASKRILRCHPRNPGGYDPIP